MIIFCILGFSIIFIALIIWIFGREGEDFKIVHILGVVRKIRKKSFIEG